MGTLPSIDAIVASMPTDVFTSLMVGDPQYFYDDCNDYTYSTSNYAVMGYEFCKHGPDDKRLFPGTSANSWRKRRSNHYMMHVKYALMILPLNGNLPAGANILGDLTDYGEDDELKEIKAAVDVDDDQYRIWQSLGNHDVKNNIKSKGRLLGGGQGCYNNRCAKRMEEYMQRLLPQWEDHNNFKFHNFYTYDKDGTDDSLAYMYIKNGIVFMNLQMHVGMDDTIFHHQHSSGRTRHNIAAPFNWFKSKVDNLQNGRSGMFQNIKGIVLMWHYDHRNNDDNWPSAKQYIIDNNKDTSKIPFIAIFNGHKHKRCGYKKYSAFQNANANGSDIPRFYVGAAEFSCFLTVEFNPNNEKFIVYATVYDDGSTNSNPSSNNNEDISADVTALLPLSTGNHIISTGMKRRCIHKNGFINEPGRCTEFGFDGSTRSFTPDAPTVSVVTP